MYPKLVCNINKMKHNIQIIKKLSDEKGIIITAVVKGMSAWTAVCQEIVSSGITSIADSRIANLKKLMHLDAEKILLRIPMKSELRDVVCYADISLNSELETLYALNEICEEKGIRHGIMLMIDVGDRREGILPEEVKAYTLEIATLQNLFIAGVGMNITCYGAILPSEENLELLVQCADEVASIIKYPLKYISGGNSSSFLCMTNSLLPKKINHLRLGEVLLQGRETETGEILSDLHSDTFTMEAEVVELKWKPSLPKGRQGVDAFGNKPNFEDKGVRKRAIVAIGRQDINANTYAPFDPNIEILGSSSDHMILDVTESTENIKLGSIIQFHINYEGLLSLSTSKYVEKEIYHEGDEAVLSILSLS